MTRRRATVVALLALVTLGLHLVLVRAMAHGHVAHVLLGSGNAAPPLGAALLAVTLVVVRLGAVVVAPGALLAAAASLLAHVSGRPAARRQRARRSGSARRSGQRSRNRSGARGRRHRKRHEIGHRHEAGRKRLDVLRGRCCGGPRHQHRGPRDPVVAIDRVPRRAHRDRAQHEHAEEDAVGGARPLDRLGEIEAWPRAAPRASAPRSPLRRLLHGDAWEGSANPRGASLAAA